MKSNEMILFVTITMNKDRRRHHLILSMEQIQHVFRHHITLYIEHIIPIIAVTEINNDISVRIVLTIGNEHEIKRNIHRISSIADSGVSIQIETVETMDNVEGDNGEVDCDAKDNVHFPIIIGRME